MRAQHVKHFIKLFQKSPHRCYAMCHNSGNEVRAMDFPTVVKYTREQLSISQEELAHALKISFTTVNRWENGKTHPNKMAQFVFFNFCERHGISAESMLTNSK